MMDEVHALRSFKRINLHWEPGSKAVPTVDLLTSPGWIILSHPSIEVVKQDHAQIHKWAAASILYDIDEADVHIADNVDDLHIHDNNPSTPDQVFEGSTKS